MSTQLFFRGTVTGVDSSDYSTGNNDAKLNGTASGWRPFLLSTARGNGTLGQHLSPTVTGPTSGIEAGQNAGAPPAIWYSPPIDADITIAGSITWNLWASEATMNDNVAINGRLEVIDGATGAITLIDQTARVTEVAVTTRAVNNFAETPAAGVLCKRGDRLRVRIFGDDAGTMAVGGSFTFSCSASSAGVDGDSYLTLTETLSFASEPAGSQIFPTDTASDVVTVTEVPREAWTTRGSGAANQGIATVNGWTSGLEPNDGSLPYRYYTRRLAAFTLGGAVRCNIWGLESNVADNVAPRVEVAVVDGDGTNPTVWASGASVELTDVNSAVSFLISGDDLAVTAGRRLRIRLLLDDAPDAAMVAGHTDSYAFNSPSGGVNGDTYMTFTQALTEFVPSLLPRAGRSMRQLMGR